VVEIINGYTVTFEDGQYRVTLLGANSNVADVTNVNQVSIQPNNSAGQVVVSVGSGVTAQDKLDIALGVWQQILDSGMTAEQVLQAKLTLGQFIGLK